MTRDKFMVAAALEKKPTASGAKMEQWSMTLLPLGKPRPIDSMASMF